MIQLDIKINTTHPQRVLGELAHALSGPSLLEFLLDDAGDFMSNDIVQRFAYEGDAASGDWQELSEGTLNIKRYLPDLVGSPEDINIRTGEMFKALTNKESYDYLMGDGWAQMNVPGDLDPLTERKVQTAQKGSTNNPIPEFGPTPPRPVLATSEMHLGVLLELLERHIMGLLTSDLMS